MITDKFLSDIGFEKDMESDTTWSLELDCDIAEGVYIGDLIFIEVCTEMQKVNLHYLNDNDNWKIDDCINIFFNNIDSDDKILQFLTLINN